MPKRPDFYCDFYCAPWDGLRETGTPGHRWGSRPSRRGTCGAPLLSLDRGTWSGDPRSSGSRRVKSEAQRPVPVGRPGIDGLRVWQTSPIGSIRRGR